MAIFNSFLFVYQRGRLNQQDISSHLLSSKRRQVKMDWPPKDWADRLAVFSKVRVANMVT